MSTFAEALGELLMGIMEVAAFSPRREDLRHIRGMPQDEAGAIALMSRLPQRLRALERMPRSELEIWYRGSLKQAKVKVVDVAELQFDDVGNLVADAINREDVQVEEWDLDGDLVYVAFREDSGEDVEAGVWGLADGHWAVIVTADSADTRAEVAKAVAHEIAAIGDRTLRRAR